jgi:hypothetical protein
MQYDQDLSNRTFYSYLIQGSDALCTHVYKEDLCNKQDIAVICLIRSCLSTDSPLSSARDCNNQERASARNIMSCCSVRCRFVAYSVGRIDNQNVGLYI